MSDVKTDDGLEEAYAQPPYEGKDAGDNTAGGKEDPIDRLKEKNSGKGPVPGGASSRLKQLGQTAGNFAKQNRNPLLGAGGITAIIFTLIFGASGFLGLFEAVHVAENVKQDVMRKLNHEEDKEAQSIMKQILAKAVNGRGGPTADSSDADPVEKNLAETDAEGLTSDLESNGITPSYDSDGKLTGLTAADGTAIDPASLSADELNTITSAVPVSEAEVNTDLTDITHFQDGVDYDVLNGKDDENVEEDITKDVVAPEGAAPDAGDPTLNDITSEEASTGDSAKAVAKGIEDVGGEVAESDDTPETLVTVGCILGGIVGNGYKNHYATLTKELIRSSAVLFSIADQSKSGQNMSLKSLGGFVSGQLNGNPNASTAEGKLNFDQSAGWKQVTGQPVTSSNPGINPAADPNTPLSGWSSTLQFLTTNAATSVSCGIILNPYVQWGGSILTDIGEAIVNIPDGESVSVADIAGSVGLHAALNGGGILAANKATQTGPVKSVITRLSNILLDAAGLAVTGGNEDAVQFLNNSKLGGDMTANTTARYLGGHRLSKTDALAMESEADNEQATQLAKSSVWNQTFSLANINSVASRLLIQLPATKTAALADIFSVMKLPSNLIGGITSLFNNRASAATTDFSDSQQFGLTDTELNMYSVGDNSDYMTNPNRGVSIPISNTQSVMVPRDYFLGDPSEYKPSQGDLPTCDNTVSAGSCPTGSYPGIPTPIAHNALLGCYVNAVEDPSQAEATICGDMLDFQESDNPANLTDADFAAIYCYGAPSFPDNHCKASVSNEDIHYGKFLLDYHLSSTLMQYSNAVEGRYSADDASSGGSGGSGVSACTTTPCDAYIVGDSYMVRAANDGIVSTFKQAGINVTINGDVGRSITGPGQSGSGTTTGTGVGGTSGLTAVQSDSAQIGAAQIVIVELGTNYGNTSSSMQSILTAIRAENPTAKIFWVNVGALGYVASRPGSYASYNTENSLIQSLSSGSPSYTVIDWCSQVFSNAEGACTISGSPANPSLLDPSDGVHPSEPAGMTAYIRLLLTSITGQPTVTGP